MIVHSVQSRKNTKSGGVLNCHKILFKTQVQYLVGQKYRNRIESSVGEQIDDLLYQLIMDLSIGYRQK